MKNSWIFKVAVGTACLGLGLSITYACKDFLDTPAQGTLNENALATKAGVEGSLIAAYRSLEDRKSTRLNSSHSQISYAVFCLKKKKEAKTGKVMRNAIRAR